MKDNFIIAVKKSIDNEVYYVHVDDIVYNKFHISFTNDVNQADIFDNKNTTRLVTDLKNMTHDSCVVTQSMVIDSVNPIDIDEAYN